MVSTRGRRDPGGDGLRSAAPARHSPGSSASPSRRSPPASTARSRSTSSSSSGWPAGSVSRPPSWSPALTSAPTDALPPIHLTQGESMQRHHRNAAPRVGLGTLIVGIALSLMAFGMSSPAQAADVRASSQVAATPGAGSDSRPHARRAGQLDGRLAVALRRWQIRFNWAETRQMSAASATATSSRRSCRTGPPGSCRPRAASCGSSRTRQ